MPTIHRYNSDERQHYLFKQQYTFKLKPRLLYAGDLKKSRKWSEKMHSHTFCEIIYIVDGKGTITLGDKVRQIKRGDIVIYNPDTMHAEESSEQEPLEIRFMALDRLEITDLPRNHLLPPDYDYIYSAGQYEDLFVSEFEKMIHEFETQNVFYFEIAQNIARTLMMYILRIINEHMDEDSLFQNNNLNLAIKYIHENYYRHITLEDIAANCYLNKYYLSHLFTRLHGMSVGKYIKQLQLNDAMTQLRETNDSVESIANKVGYNDTGHFCRTFKKATSMTPLQYRKSHNSQE